MGCTHGSLWPIRYSRQGDADSPQHPSPKREKWPANIVNEEGVVAEYVEGTSMLKIITPDHSRRNTIEERPPLIFPGDMQSPADYREVSSKDKVPTRSVSTGSRSSGYSESGAGGFVTPQSCAHSLEKENGVRNSVSAFVQFIEGPPLHPLPSFTSSPTKSSIAQNYVDTLRKRKQEELQRSQESKLAKVAGAEELIKQSLATPFSGLSLREPLSPEE